MTTLITVFHVLCCIVLMLSVLLQSGKGGMGAAFGGGGGTQTVFGGSGAGSFLRKLTVGAAVIFMLSSMTLAWLSSRTGTDALKRYSAQQRRAAQLKKEARLEALEGKSRDGGVGEVDTAGDAGAGDETAPINSNDGEETDPGTAGSDDGTGGAPGTSGGDEAGSKDPTEVKNRGPPQDPPGNN